MQPEEMRMGDLIFGSPVRTGSGELSYAIGRDGTMTTYMEASLNYDHLFADKHRVGALFLYNHKIHTRTQEGDKFKSLPLLNETTELTGVCVCCVCVFMCVLRQSSPITQANFRLSVM